MHHLTQPNKEITLMLDFTANDGRLWQVPYTYIMEPVISDKKPSWRSVKGDPDDEALFDLWCSRQHQKNVGLWEAISVFKDDLYPMCIEHIAINDNKEHWLDLLNKIKNDKKLDVERAKAFDITELMRRYGLEPKMNFVCCPLHGEDTPSLKIYPNTNTWHCYGCGAGSDTIDFVMAMNKCSFVEAVKFLT